MNKITHHTGNIYIISAPSGGGKTSLVKSLLKLDSSLCKSISYTTRNARGDEKNAIDYFFITHQEFESKIAAKDFIEYAKVFDYYYGTSESWITKTLQQGKDVILEIDWQGAINLKRILPSSISIFIMPPSKEILIKRLTSRNTDSQEIIAKRLNEAALEISKVMEYDYLLVNDDFAVTLDNLYSIVKASRFRMNRQLVEQKEILKPWFE